MNKLILKMFGFLRSFFHFLKVLTMLFLMLHCIFWAQNLIGSDFGWLKIFTPILSVFVAIGGAFSKGSVDLFGAVFEYKYMIAVGLYIGVYFLFNYFMLVVDKIEDKYDDLVRFVKKSQENVYNSSLKRQQEKNEKSIKKYKILVSTSIKKKFSHTELNYNLEEQNKIMNKFLVEKTGVVPAFYNGGFLYSFNDFDNVDNILEIFFKLIKSNSPLDYVICFQIEENSEDECLKNLDTLLGLRNENKISMLSDSAYRYKFNAAHRYGTSQLGLFQKENDTIELHQFIEI